MHRSFFLFTLYIIHLIFCIKKLLYSKTFRFLLCISANNDIDTYTYLSHINKNNVGINLLKKVYDVKAPYVSAKFSSPTTHTNIATRSHSCWFPTENRERTIPKKVQTTCLLAYLQTNRKQMHTDTQMQRPTFERGYHTRYSSVQWYKKRKRAARSDFSLIALFAYTLARCCWMYHSFTRRVRRICLPF